jgi:predicted phosphodiesterase
LSQTEWLQVGEVLIYTLHDLADLNLDLTAAGIQVVVSGHSRQPLVEERNGVPYVNPGSAGRQRFTLPTMAELAIVGTTVTARIAKIAPPSQQ